MEGGAEQNLMCWVICTVKLDLSLPSSSLNRCEALGKSLAFPGLSLDRQHWKK